MGYGASVTAPMAVPQDPVDVYLRGDMPPVENPKQQAITPIQEANSASVKLSARAMPPMANVEDLKRGRLEEAAEQMLGMKRAFAITKAYQRQNKKASERQGKKEQKAAKNLGKSGGSAGVKRSARNAAMVRASAYRASR